MFSWVEQFDKVSASYIAATVKTLASFKDSGSRSLNWSLTTLVEDEVVLQPALQCCQAENQTNKSQIRLLSDNISTKKQTKSGPKPAILVQNQTCSQNLFATLGKSTFILKYSIFKEMFKWFFTLCGRLKNWKSDFSDFFDQKPDFSGKKRTDWAAFFFKSPLLDQGLLKRTYLAALRC